MKRQQIIDARKKLEAEAAGKDYATLACAGLEGPWVSPPQKTSCNCSGPVLVGHNFLDLERAKKYACDILKAGGYLPGIPFNCILDCALDLAGMTRGDIYITQALHLLPRTRSPDTSEELLRRSFCEVTLLEIRNRRVIALGAPAKRMCLEWKHCLDGEPICLDHPSKPKKGCGPYDKAKELACALRKLG